MNYVTPAGFRDVLTDEAQQRERITRAVQERFAARGYLPIETPTLEVMDVMRAGGRLAGVPVSLLRRATATFWPCGPTSPCRSRA